MKALTKRLADSLSDRFAEARRLRRCDPEFTLEAGFTLMELLIVISIMLILMLIAIPNMLHLKATANETSAIQSLRGRRQRR